MSPTPEDLLDDPLAVAGAVAVTYDRTIQAPDPERNGLVQRLWGDFDSLGEVLEMGRQEIADLLGCDSPHPHLWLETSLPTLRRSADIVGYLRRQVDPAEGIRPTREAGRLALLMAVETLSRCQGQVGVADFVMSERGDTTGESPSSLLHQGNLGGARRMVVSRLGKLSAGLEETRTVWLVAGAEDAARHDRELRATIRAPFTQARR